MTTTTDTAALISSEISDFCAGLEMPGEPLGALEIQAELMRRIIPLVEAAEARVKELELSASELRAQGVDEFAETLGSPYEERGGRTYEDGFTRAVETIKVIRAPVFAQHLRAGRKG